MTLLCSYGLKIDIKKEHKFLIGERLKELREDQGMTQNDLAICLNISRTSVSAYELNTNEPSLDILINIADFFNISTDYLLCRTKEKHNLNLLNSGNKELLLKLYDAINSYKILKK